MVGRGRIPGDIDPLLVSITGAIVTWWGRIEGVLVYDLLASRQHPAARPIAEKQQFPVSTSRVIAQWARCRRAIFAGNPGELRRVENTRQRLADAAKDRHALVHGFWPYGGDPADPTTLRLQMIKPKKGETGMMEVHQRTITIDSLDDFNERLIHLYHTVMADAFNLIASMPVDTTDNRG